MGRGMAGLGARQGVEGRAEGKAWVGAWQVWGQGMGRGMAELGARHG